MGDYSAQFGTDLCLALGYQPTIDNLLFLQAWATAEGGHARFNPFNTTQPVAGSTWYNTFGDHGQYHVQNYPNYGAGLNATVHTLTNGNYQPILNAIAAGGDAMIAAQAVADSPWGTGGGVLAVLTAENYHYQLPPSTPPPALIPIPMEDEAMPMIIDAPDELGAWVLFPDTGVYIHLPDNADVAAMIGGGAHPPAGFVTRAFHNALLLGRPPYSIPAA